MKLNPLVSICIPTHNQDPAFLKKCIESAIHQTYKNIEIVINNNNTTNESLLYLKNLPEQAGTNIKIYTNDHTVSFMDSYKQAIHHSTGDYLVILPSDDFFEINAIEVLVNALNQHPDVDCICGQWRYVDKEFNEVRLKQNQLHYENKEYQLYDALGLKINYMVYCLIRADYLKNMDLSLNKKITYAMDFVFTNEVTLHGNVVVIDEIIANFQLYNPARKGRIVEDIIDTFEILYHTISDIDEDKDLKNKISKKIIAIIIINQIRRLVLSIIISSLKLNFPASQLINTIVYTVKMSFSLMILLIKL